MLYHFIQILIGILAVSDGNHQSIHNADNSNLKDCCL